MSRRELPGCPECGCRLREDYTNGMAMCLLSYAECSRDGVYLTQEQVLQIRNEQTGDPDDHTPAA